MKGSALVDLLSYRKNAAQPARAVAAKGAGKPATCIALSGGYGDDDDTGDTVWYTGEGGQDANRAQARGR